MANGDVVSEEIQLRGHVGAVLRLATVPSDDGRTLLVSGDAEGSAQVWDPWTGELVAGPLAVDETMVLDLAVLRLGAGKWALLSSGMRGVRLWHPHRLDEAGPSPLRRFSKRGVGLMVVLPETAATPQLVVTRDGKGIRVTDPASGRTLFKRSQSGFLRGYGNQTESLVGLRLDDDTPGFAAARYEGAVEVWAAVRGRRWKRLHHWVSPSKSRGFAMTVLVGERGEPLLALAAGRGVEVWDPRTGQCTARVDLDMRCTALASVPLGDRTVLAAGGEGRNGGVRLWDPSTGRMLGALFNGHGPSTIGMAPEVKALAVVRGADGTVRVASAGSDAVVRVSPPFSGPDDTPPEQLPTLPQRAESQDEQRTGQRGSYAFVRNRSGAVTGLWLANAQQAKNPMFVDALLFHEGLSERVGMSYRTVPNTVDDAGGVFVLFDEYPAPGDRR